MAGSVVPPVADQSTARPNVLAYPSATTARYLIFVAALVCSGLFVGNWVHNDVKGDEWARTVAACGIAFPESVNLDDFEAGGAAVLDQQRATACTRDVEQTRATFIFGGAALIVVAAVMLFVLTPRVVERRRRLRPLGPKLAGASERFSVLAEEAGVSGRVQPRIGSATQRDAFSYGIPMSNRVALPPAVAARWRDAATFDTVVAHELAHVSRRDVSLAWLVRSIGYVMVPIFLIPIVVGLIGGDVSLVLEYFWRVVVLAFVVLLLSNSLLRTREYDADIHAAAQLRNPAQVEALLSRTTARPPGRWAWLRARHPTPQKRIIAVAEPDTVTRVDFEDGFTSGFLTALAVPLLVSAFTTALATIELTAGARVISAAMMGPILGASVGLALWHAAVVARVVGRDVAVMPIALGVGVGFALGEVMSLAQAGGANLTGLEHPVWIVVVGLAGAGATVLSASLGETWADVAPGLSRARFAWLMGLAVNALLFSSVLWAADLLQEALDFGGWELGRWALVAGLSSWQMTVIVLAVTAAAVLPMVWRPGRRTAPPWAIESGVAPNWQAGGRSGWLMVIGVGLGAGITGALAIMVYRGQVGASDDFDELWLRYWSYAWVAAGASVAASLVLQIAVPRRGAAAGLVAGVLAALTSSIGFLIFNTALGGDVTWAFASDFTQAAIVLGFYGTLVVSVLSLLTPRRTRVTASVASPLAVGGAVITSALFAVLLLTGRGYVAPSFELEVSTGFAESESDSTAVSDDLRAYLLEVLPSIEERYLPALGVAAGVDSGQFPGSEVNHLEVDVQQPLRELVDEMQAYEPATAEVRSVHEHLVATLQSAERGTDLLITAYADADTAARDAALDEFSAAAQHWDDWLQAREALATSVLER